MAQYDSFAFDYQELAAASPMREPEWYSLRQRLGDITGLCVLDLACDDGQARACSSGGRRPAWWAWTPRSR